MPTQLECFVKKPAFCDLVTSHAQSDCYGSITYALRATHKSEDSNLLIEVTASQRELSGQVLEQAFTRILNNNGYPEFVVAHSPLLIG